MVQQCGFSGSQKTGQNGHWQTFEVVVGHPAMLSGNGDLRKKFPFRAWLHTCYAKAIHMHLNFIAGNTEPSRIRPFRRPSVPLSAVPARTIDTVWRPGQSRTRGLLFFALAAAQSGLRVTRVPRCCWGSRGSRGSRGHRFAWIVELLPRIKTVGFEGLCRLRIAQGVI